MASVLPQIGPDCEIIVVDDGSDPAVETAHRSVRVVRTTGLGPAGARAVGLAACRGAYVAWCDDDDEWLPGHLDVLIKALESDPAVSLVYGDAEWHGPGRHPATAQSWDFDGYLLSDDNYLSISAVVHRADAARIAGGFDPELTAFEDWDLWLRMAATGQALRHVAVTVARRHGHTGNHAYSPGQPDWDSYRRVHGAHERRHARPIPAFDPLTWKAARQLLCRAVLRPFEGYGVVSINLLRELEARGVEISTLPEGNQPTPQTESLHRPVPGMDRLAFYYDYRNRPGELGCERVVFYTMWESSDVPEHLVATANSCALG